MLGSFCRCPLNRCRCSQWRCKMNAEKRSASMVVGSCYSHVPLVIDTKWRWSGTSAIQMWKGGAREIFQLFTSSLENRNWAQGKSINISRYNHDIFRFISAVPPHHPPDSLEPIKVTTTEDTPELCIHRERERERETETETETETDRQTEKEIETDRQTDRERDRDR